MSRAFVREDDQVQPDAPPELKVSGLPNWVTPRGLRLIEAKLDELEQALAADPDEQRAAYLRRDMRYWTHQRASAQLAEPLGPDPEEVAFGARVGIRRSGGRPETIEIVGEDEADPAEGRVSWASPLARALTGAAVGEAVELGGREIEILSIAPIA